MPYLFLDLETTGLESALDRILEVGWLLVNDDMTPLQAGPVRNAVVTPSIGTMQIIEANQFIQDMHGKSGLLDDLMEPTTIELREVENRLIADLEAAAPAGEPVMLAGSGIHFDKQFISIWMPNLYAKLHYRIFDTSTLMRFFEPIGVLHGVESTGREHRADADVEFSLAVARSYKQTVGDLVCIVHAFKEGEL